MGTENSLKAKTSRHVTSVLIFSILGLVGIPEVGPYVEKENVTMSPLYGNSGISDDNDLVYIISPSALF